MPFFDLKQKLATELATALNHPEITHDSVLSELSSPPNIQMGHFALPCFKIGKLLSKPAGKLAIELSQSFKSSNFTSLPAGPYANFRLKPSRLFTDTVPLIQEKQNSYGSQVQASSAPVILEYCSPNIAKPLFFHHIRSTLIGNVLANIYEHLGHPTKRLNFVGDWGTQFARLLAAFELWGKHEKLSLDNLEESMKHLLDIYIQFHKEIEVKPELAGRAQDCLKRLEAQEPATTQLWKLVRDISVANMNLTLLRMNVRFDSIEGESHYIPQIEKTLTEIKEKAQGKPSEGAWIVEVEGIETPALIQKKDGTTLYLTRDIAAAIERFERFSFEKMLYIVSEQQTLHFKQLFGVLAKMGYPWSKRCEHLSFGTVHFGAARMSTREGRVIYLDDVLKEATDLALKECTAKNPNLQNKETVAEQIGVGAIIFGELSAHKQREIEFNWEHVLAFDGETGPYVQYAAVRCYSLGHKAKELGLDPTTIPDVTNYEFAVEEEALILELSKFRFILRLCTGDNEPYHLTHYLIDTAKAFNRFYYKFPVLQATDPIQKQVRLSLVQATYHVIHNGLKLLGIHTPKEM